MLAKKEQFRREDALLADVAKALAHPARISILKFLSKTNSCMCGDIVESLPLAQSTVSQHLKELKKVGLIEGEIDGPKICYCINNKVLSESKIAFDKLFLKLGCC